MIEPGSDEWFAQVLKQRETEFFCRFRNRHVLPVASAAKAVVERVLEDPVISSLIEFHEYTALHFRERGLRFSQRQDITAMLPRLVEEPRALIGLGNKALTFTCGLRINCDNLLVKQKVAGKQRQVPDKKDYCSIEFDFSGEAYCTPAFLQPFLHLIGDCFGIIDGDYGWVRRHFLDVWTNQYDDRYGDLFAPQFLTWVNLLGSRHVESIGRERFHTSPAHSCVDLPGGGILLTMCPDPRDFLSPQVQDTVTRAKKHLGILAPSERATPEELAAFYAEMHAPMPASPSPFAEAFRRADEETPGQMARQAEGTIEGVKQFWNVTLDCTPASASVIDRLIVTGFNPDEEEDIETAVQAFGAYLGECARRHYGGAWRDEDMKGQPVLLDVGPKRQRVDPFRAVRQRFEKRESGFALQEWFNSLGR
jgi:hypothetical protein